MSNHKVSDNQPEISDLTWPRCKIPGCNFRVCRSIDIRNKYCFAHSKGDKTIDEIIEESKILEVEKV